MILDEIILRNFGAYLGQQSILVASPDPQKPVVLVGGLNGAGKTTLLEALQVALYGGRARCTNRAGVSHEEFLRRCIHRAIDPREGSSVEIKFRLSAEGSQQSYRIRRSWRVNGKGLEEDLEVRRDDRVDRVLAESWAEYVEELIPSRISHLFFFDGEQIEAFADSKNSAELLSVAIHSLLGLDLVDRLATDLIVLERKRRKGPKPDGGRQQIEDMEAEIKKVEELRAELVAQCGAARNEVARAEKVLRETESRFRQEGGDLYEQRKEIETERASIEAQLSALEKEAREAAEGPAPLLLVQDLLTGAYEQGKREEESRQANLLRDTLYERDQALLRKIKSNRWPSEIAAVIRDLLTEDRAKRAAATDCQQYLRLSFEARHLLDSLGTISVQLGRSLSRLLESACDLSPTLVDLERKLAGVPNDETIAHMIVERDAAAAALEAAKTRLARLDSEFERVKRELEQKQAALVRQIEKVVEFQFEREDSSRILTHSQKVRQTLQRFRVSVVRNNLERIQHLVLDSLRQLLRKQSLVTNLAIDPERFTIDLRGLDGQVVPPDKLAAGERQLLAVSLLWGLGRASGRPLPTVIDTPLGRLDSTHRTNLIERYFPCASHQVVLLSTDEEINADYYRKLRPWVGRCYRLEFDDKRGATTVEPGYFW